jgi:L-fuculose-phosphate aldolase
MQNPDFERVGKRLHSENLVGASFGNMSVRKGNEGFYIKRTGAYLDTAGEPIFVPMTGDVQYFQISLQTYKLSFPQS